MCVPDTLYNKSTGMSHTIFKTSSDNMELIATKQNNTKRAAQQN